MLSVFVKNDDKYKSYAYKICGCHELKHDLVNDMYIKLDAILRKDPEKKITNGIIFLMIRSIFIDGIRRNKEIPVEYVPEETEDNTNVLCERLTMDEVLSEMSFFDREILLKAQENSFRKIGREINCHHSSISKMYDSSLNKAKKLCQEKGMLVERVKV